MDVEVDRGDLRNVRVHRATPSELAAGEVRVRVDSFALTSNNITYAVFGDALRYWNFFPADPPWGRVPVWGFGDVVESRSDDAPLGDRLYGYFPMSSEVTFAPGRADERGFSDLAEHRAPMAGAYNRYARVAHEPLYRSNREDHQMALFPLFFTSFLIDDFVSDAGFDVGQVVLSSASSKTSIGVAFLARARGGVAVVGLTSPVNVDFVEGLGVYDRVLTYDETDGLDATPSVYIDVSGNRDVLHAVHDRLSTTLRHSMTVGGTHWEHEPVVVGDTVADPQPEFFFAPTQISKRSKEWGREGLDARVGDAWDRYATWVDGWIDFQRIVGPDEVAGTYLALLEGHVDPRVGSICTLQDR